MNSPVLPLTEKEILATKCPLCGGPAQKIVVRTGQRVVLRCSDCTNGWTYPPFSQLPSYEHEHFGGDAAGTIGTQSRKQIEMLPKQWQKFLRILESQLLSRIPVGGRWLDIGCAEGWLLERLRSQGRNGVGVEPSQEARELARSIGLEVHAGYFPHPDVRGPFDAILMSHVFEHISDLSCTLKSIVEAAAGGYLFLAQTNYEGIVPRTLGDRWYAWCPDHHYYHFTPHGLTRFLQSHGFSVEKVTPVSMVHLSRRYRYLLPLFDLSLRMADQFILQARIPKKWTEPSAT